MGQYKTFIIRIWCEDDESKIKGQIHIANTMEQAYFENLQDMKQFISEHLGLSSDMPGNQNKFSW